MVRRRKKNLLFRRMKTNAFLGYFLVGCFLVMFAVLFIYAAFKSSKNKPIVKLEMKTADELAKEYVEAEYSVKGTPVSFPLRGEDGELISSAGYIHCADISPDGKMLAAAAFTGVFVWNEENHIPYRCFEGYTEPVVNLNFSPAGEKLLTIDRWGNVHLLNVESGRTLHSFSMNPWEKSANNRAHYPYGYYANSPYKTAFSPDGNYFAICEAGTKIRVWEVKTGLCLQVFRFSPYRAIGFVFSHDSKELLAVSAFDNQRWPAPSQSDSQSTRFTLWSMTDGKSIRQFDIKEDISLCAAFTPDGRRILAGGNRCLAVLDKNSGAIIQRIDIEDKTMIQSPIPAPLTAVYSYRTNSANTRLSSYFPFEPPFTAFTAFSADGERFLRIAPLRAAEQIKGEIWDLRSGKKSDIFMPDQGYIPPPAFSLRYYIDRSELRAIGVSANWKELLIQGRQNRLTGVWNRESCEWRTIGGGDYRLLEKVSFSEDESKAQIYFRDGSIDCWNFKTGEMLHESSAPTAATKEIREPGLIQKSPNQEYALLHVNESPTAEAAVNESPTDMPRPRISVELANWPSRKHIGNLGDSFLVDSTPVFSPDSRWLVLGDRTGMVTIFEAASGKTRHSFRIAQEDVNKNIGRFSKIQFSHNSQKALAIYTIENRDGSVKSWFQLYDLKAGKENSPVYQKEERIEIGDFSPGDGALCVCGKHIYLIDTATGTILLTLSHPGSPYPVQFSNDGQWLLTDASLWDAKTGALIKRLNPGNADIHYAVFSRDKKRLLAGVNDGTIRLWDLSALP
ncbi:MAG: WD40 repeat domain-containing protein [Candidatus Omnitrophota bacterium]